MIEALQALRGVAQMTAATIVCELASLLLQWDLGGMEFERNFRILRFNRLRAPDQAAR